MTQTKLYWRITGHDGTKTIYQARVGYGHFSEKKIETLLKALVAKAGLTYAEIVGAYARRGTNIANKLLEVHRVPNHLHFVLECGTKPYFLAEIVDSKGKLIKFRDPSII